MKAVYNIRVKNKIIGLEKVLYKMLKTVKTVKTVKRWKRWNGENGENGENVFIYHTQWESDDF